MKIKNFIKGLVRCGTAATIAAAIMALAACSDKVDNVFGESAANRVAKSQADYYAILESSENGWAVDFYPSDRIEGGVAYTARFKDGKVAMRCEQDINNTVISKKFTAGTAVTSDYRIVSETGVMLTFDTYNGLFHYWSQPFKGAAKGYESDYEFTFLSASKDEVVLRGKKYGNLVHMYPLQMSATDYISKVKAMHATLKDIPRKRAVVNGQTLNITMAYNLLTYQDGDALRSVSFIHTPDGIRLYEPITFGGATVSCFSFDAATQELRSADEHIVLPKPTAVEQTFVVPQKQWLFSYKWSTEQASDMSEELIDIIKNFSTILDQKGYGEKIRELYLGANMEPFANDKHRWVLGIRTRVSGIDFYIGYAVEIELTDADRLLATITMKEPANLWSNYGFFRPFIDFVGNNSPYLLSFDDVNNPTEATLTSKKDATKSFKVKLKK